MHDDVVGIVLAGGRSSRLTGLDLGDGGKAALDIGGEPCLSRVCRAIAAVVPRVIVVAAAGQPLPPLPDGVEIIRDTTPNAGPLAGIRDEVEAMARSQVDQMVQRLELVKREELDAALELARRAREGQEALEARLATLEARLAELAAAPGRKGRGHAE